jgi:hypothetical protein
MSNNLSRYRERIENALGSKEPAIRAGREICKSHLEKWAEYFGIAVETLEDEATTDKKH